MSSKDSLITNLVVKAFDLAKQMMGSILFAKSNSSTHLKMGKICIYFIQAFFLYKFEPYSKFKILNKFSLKMLFAMGMKK